jgi:hypothetical protein
MSATWCSISLSIAIFKSEAAEFSTDFCEMVDFCVSHILCDFKLPLRRKSGLHSSVMLRSINWLLPTLRNNLIILSLTVSLLKMGLTGCPETSVAGYQSTLPNIPEERRFRETCTMQPYCQWFRPIISNQIRVFFKNFAHKSCGILLSISWWPSVFLLVSKKQYFTGDSWAQWQGVRKNRNKTKQDPNFRR